MAIKIEIINDGGGGKRGREREQNLYIFCLNFIVLDRKIHSKNNFTIQLNKNSTLSITKINL